MPCVYNRSLCSYIVIAVAAFLFLANHQKANSDQQSPLNAIKPRFAIELTDDPATALCFADRGEILAIGYVDRIRFYDWRSGKLLSEVKASNKDQEICRHLAFSADDKRLVSVHECSRFDRPRISVHLWEINEKKELKSIAVLTNRAGRFAQRGTYYAQFSPDGQTVVGDDSSGIITLWEAKSGKELRNFRSGVAATFSPDGRFLYVVSCDGEIRKWNAETAEPVEVAVNAPRQDYLLVDRRVAFSSKSKLAALSDGYSILLKDIDSGKTTRHLVLGNTLGSMSFSPDGQTLAVSEYENGYWFLDCPSGKVAGWFGVDKKAYGSVGYSVDGKLVGLVMEKVIRGYDAEFALRRKGNPPVLEKSDPPDTPLAVQLTFGSDSYSLDLGGLNAKEFAKRLTENKITSPQKISGRCRITNTSQKEIAIRFDDAVGIHLIGPGAMNLGDSPSQTGLNSKRPEPIRIGPGKHHDIMITTLGRSYWVLPGEYSIHVSIAVPVSPSPKGADAREDGFGLVVLRCEPIKVMVREQKK